MGVERGEGGWEEREWRLEGREGDGFWRFGLVYIWSYSSFWIV